MSRPSRQGFSIVELVVSLFLAALVLLLSVRLLREAQVVFVDWQRMAPQPEARLGEALIRADVQSASRTLNGTVSWSTGPLILAPDQDRMIRYDTILGKLVRSVEAPEESESGHRSVLRRVSSWRWRQLPGGVIEIHLLYSRPRDPGARLAGSLAMQSNTETDVDRLFLRYAMRDRAGRRTW
jgi:hypothetical protein